VPNLIVIGKTVAEISRFFDFRDGNRAPSWIYWRVFVPPKWLPK